MLLQALQLRYTVLKVGMSLHVCVCVGPGSSGGRCAECLVLDALHCAVLLLLADTVVNPGQVFAGVASPIVG